MKQLIRVKIRKYLWEAIAKGEKLHEARKLIKGLVEGDYEFVSIECECSCGTNNINTLGTGIDKTTGKEVCVYCGSSNFWPKEIFGTAHLTPNIMFNKTIEDKFSWRRGIKESDFDGFGNSLDQDTIDFVNENYYGKHEFVIYNISDVKEGE